MKYKEKYTVQIHIHINLSNMADYALIKIN